MLTQQQLQLIEDQLLGLGIKYIDLRYEMLDHIATELEEKEGDFYTNAEEYFYSNVQELIQLYKKTKQQSFIKAARYYWETLASPLGFLLFILVFGSVKYYMIHYVEGQDITTHAYCFLIPIAISFLWFGRGNKKISVFKALVQMYGLFYLFFSVINLCSLSFYRNTKGLYYVIMQYNSSFFLAFIIVLLLAISRCRERYAIKYLKTN
ncbi:hypothetical protein FUA48_03905 [Flavobacterium alkalisoli]|uniref:Uncharacterized protein n=1 Tax=Flavobacterium alkalisoli TaxID=2602769 RepID=A0A5B9FRN1_9FLAO|nr:hypothetical protein [Flavobacterium alkalisoli]QEE48746.1 hypothetical protein FUA48_03905 [Flavobacterium alkalisoli]